MASASSTNRERIDGLALFSATAFGLGLGVIGALERVGAPDGLVAALGPLLHAAMRNRRISAEVWRGAWENVGTPAQLDALNAAA